MKAMIFAAGLGTRLKEYTHDRPKALVDVGGYSLLDVQIRKMHAFGIREIVVNVHHFAEQVIDFLNNYPLKEIRFYISDESDLLLDIGGGLKYASRFFEADENVLLHNVDILSDIDFSLITGSFKGDAVLLLKDRKSARKLLFDADMQLCGWRNNETGDQIEVAGSAEEAYEYSYSGIAMVKGSFAAQLPGNGVFPLLPSLLKAAESNTVTGIAVSHQWVDVGKVYELSEAEKHINDYYTKWLK